VRRAPALIAAASLASVAAATGTGFAADTGGSSPAVTGGGGSARVVVARPGMTLPHDGAQARLSVAAGVAGQVSAPGDLFLVDTTKAPGPAHASLYVTNLAPVAASLRGFALPIAVWAERDGAWRRADDVDRYLTSSTGNVELTLGPGRRYAVSVEQGGSWIGGTGAAIAPQFYLVIA
jgi:hypothetical protein